MRAPPPPAITRERLARRAALGSSRTPTRYFREAIAVAPNDAVINTEWGELFLEKHNRQDAAKSFQAALKTEPDYAPAQRGMAQAVADENPPAAMRYVRRALELNPSDTAAYLFLAELAIDEDKKDRRARGDRQGAGDQPQQPRSVCPDGCRRFRRREGRRVQVGNRGGAEDQPPLRRSVSRRRRGYCAVLPVRRSGGAGAPGHRDRSRQCPRASRSRRASDADRRRAERAARARNRVPRRSVRPDHLQPAGCARQARELPVDSGRRSGHQAPSRRGRRSCASTCRRWPRRRSKSSASGGSSRPRGRSSSKSSRCTTTSRCATSV